MTEPYYSFSTYLKKRFRGVPVRKIPIDAGFPCPNKDGSLSFDGCIFCDTFGSGPIKSMVQALSIPEQIRSFIRERHDLKYIAYYQAHSNTCAPLAVLRQRYEIIFQFPEIVGLFIGTRPDAIAPDVYPLLQELNDRTYLTVELGLQSTHPKSLCFLQRNHTYAQFLETFATLKKCHIDTLVHLIVGIPGETIADMLATVAEMNRLKPAGIKFHLLHVLKNTPLFNLYEQKQFTLLEMDEYADIMCLLLEHLDPGIVIHRLTGERDKELFHAPAWAMDKNAVIQAIRNKMVAKNTVQGLAKK